MKKIILGILLVCVCLSNGMQLLAETNNTPVPQKQILNKLYQIYDEIEFNQEEKIGKELFVMAYLGYLNLKNNTDEVLNEHLSIADFSLSSNQPRLWVFDIKNKKLLYHTLVAHGQKTGEEFATKFSNKLNSHQSSLGFYITKETYFGDNGFSLRMEGWDKGINDKAMERAIVIHGADYVSNNFIQVNNRLGRSWGCPAVSRELAEPIINIIKEGSVLFIYHPQGELDKRSQWLKKIPTQMYFEHLYQQSHQQNAMEQNLEDSTVS